jgi:hypothetical protein
MTASCSMPRCSFDLPPAVDDALQKGIPMFFVAEATLLRDRWYWYDKQGRRQRSATCGCPTSR